MALVDNLNSIINTDSLAREVTDNIRPYTYVEYITKADLLNSSDNYLKLYKEYLYQWAKAHNNDGSLASTKKFVYQKITELLKTIAISYTTYEEQVFLSNLNWDFENLTDENSISQAKSSLYAALPLFVTKIKEIAEFYNKKRTEATFIIERQKLKGAKGSLEKIIFDNIISYLFSNNLTEQYNYAKDYLIISIDNYIDTYTEYFDIDREKSDIKTQDYNDIDKSIYFELEEVLSDMLFAGLVYLREIPLIAQLTLDLTGDCVGDKAILKEELLASNNLALIPDDEKVALKKKLYEKYLGVDFWYAYQDENGEIVQDVFIKAENPTNNLLNQQTVDTPYSEHQQLTLLKNIGLFFKPDKNSILQVKTGFSYYVDPEKFDPEKIYIFPDPTIYGNVAFNRQKDYPYIIEYSYTDYFKNFSYGWVKNDPMVLGDQQALFAYYSSEQNIDKLNKNTEINLSYYDKFNHGYVATAKTDLYGNKFGLFKEKPSNNCIGTFGRLYDIELSQPTFNPPDSNSLVVDGGTFELVEALGGKLTSADKSSWKKSDQNYYEYLVEGALCVYQPRSVRGYIPNGAIYGNANCRFAIEQVDNYNAIIIDGGAINSILNDYEITGSDTAKLLEIDEKYTSKLTEQPNKCPEKSYYDLQKVNGKLYITRMGKPSMLIEDVFLHWKESVYSDYYQYFIDNMVEFDILENVLIIKAIDPDDGSIHKLFDIIEYDPLTDSFIRNKENHQPLFFHNDKTFGNCFNNITFDDVIPEQFLGNSNIVNKVSNIFYIESNHCCYFVEMHVKNIIRGNKICPTIYPTLYEVNLTNLKTKLYQFELTDEEQVFESFHIPDNLYDEGITLINSIGELRLAFASDANEFALIYSVRDLNNALYVYKHLFKVNLNNNITAGKIDASTIDSTVYNAEGVGQMTPIYPGDPDSINILFLTNNIVS